MTSMARILGGYITENPFQPHGACSCSPLKYTHIDVAPHIPRPHDLPYSGNPVLALAYCYLIQGKCLTIRNDLPFEMQYVCEADCKPVCIPPCQPYAVPCDPCCAPNPPPAQCSQPEDGDRSPQHPYDSGCPAPCQPCDPCCQVLPPQPPGSGDQCPTAEQNCVMEPTYKPNVKRNGLNSCT
ncbi:uncharacterized protein LOC124299885 [Neodiprion virginianus]|uniref:uncharacterized protein LOC124299885 n=1 Tax=Neodiprion virginianus TaxID=2961670 RepID=UPI001EE6D7DB|nr:uncharacterized protein LOC124299885 [Neodiprion virginianus]